MRRFAAVAAAVVTGAALLSGWGLPAQEKQRPKEKPRPTPLYRHGPDSEERPGVPQGKVTKMPPWKSQVFPGTVRDWWVYVPAQYEAKTPACVMVFQDGEWYQNRKGDFRAPTVFDNLIHQKRMPVTVGVFLNPGVVPANAKKKRLRVGASTTGRGSKRGTTPASYHRPSR